MTIVERVHLPHPHSEQFEEADLGSAEIGPDIQADEVGDQDHEDQAGDDDDDGDGDPNDAGAEVGV